MDCEKFESTLIDELYDELDEVTSAAAKRHVGGCVRCASLLSGLKATRRLAVLPIVEPPPELEERILAAAREAQKVVPFGRRMSRAVSWAGSWAMRPQTAMAALFLLMIGSSALLLKGKQASAPRSAMTVSEQGEPVASATTGTLERPPSDTSESKGATAIATPAATAAPVASPLNALAAASESTLDAPATRGRLGGIPKASVAKEAPAPAKPAPAYVADLDDGEGYASLQSSQRYAAAPGAGGAANAPVAAPRAMAPPAQPTGPQTSNPASAGAMAAYEAGDYGTATTLFDGLAASNPSYALWAARSVRTGSGCAAAVRRFDQVAGSSAPASTTYAATFEAGQCYQQMGDLDSARARFGSLLTVPSYVDKAKSELSRLSPKAAAKAAHRAGPASAAPTTTAPAATTQNPSRAPAEAY